MEVSSLETLKFPSKKSCHMFQHIYQLKKLKNQGGLKWCFYVSYTMYVRTVSFSNYHCHYHYQNHYHFKLTSTDIVSV